MPANPWREAIIDALVVSHIYRAEHEDSPRMALHDLIAWEVTIALDPPVSSGAREMQAKKYKVTYDYINPSSAGPFKGSMVIDHKVTRGDEIRAVFGAAIVRSCRSIDSARAG